jgi:antitoxin component of RelBE/YafQ-DinJ toxin-antitoxin module
MQRKDAILKLRISDELKDEAEKIAREKGESLAFIIREALRQYLDRNPAKPDEITLAAPAPFPFTADQLQALQRSSVAMNAERLRKLVDYLESESEIELETRVAEEPEPANGNAKP